MGKCVEVLGYFRFTKISCTRVGAMWTEGIENSEVKAEWAS